jgi:Uma2 family endonuclease
MSAILNNPKPPQPLKPHRRRWTRQEFYRMGEQGYFDGQRVELLDGEIVVISAMKDYHLAGIDVSAEVLQAVFGTGYWVRRHGQLDLLPNSAPLPDIAIVPGSAKGSTPERGNPTTALLIVEVSWSTLLIDRGRKLRIYAKAGIQDYWILNLEECQLEVYRQPELEPGRKRRFHYGQTTILLPTDRVSPLAAPQASILVSDLLP